MRAWLELARVSNLPTCLSNVLVGAAIGGLSAPIDWGAVAPVAASVVLFYVAGMALNDVVDRRVDARRRPERPIPSGRITTRAALGFAGVCLAGGIALAALAGTHALMVAVVLAAVIVAYDLVHKRFAASVLLMGACRGLVYVLVAAALTWPPEPLVTATLGTAITAYIALVSVVARVEAGPRLGARRWLALLLVPVALGPAAVIRPESWTWTVVAAVALTAWLRIAARHAIAQPPRTSLAVHGWLAGICLLDGLYLALLDRPELAAAAAACFAVTVAAHRRILGT